MSVPFVGIARDSQRFWIGVVAMIRSSYAVCIISLGKDQPRYVQQQRRAMHLRDGWSEGQIGRVVAT